ncbi:hypothetical protein [Caldivirga sp. MU80]|uniref:hypothetical protein n=1 Tax=Caldivirga sp. MU80 TaxID=1650354 RepID=UPI0012E7ECD4|nr:hypothetical protein [Caldivirga sp. MU80]
MRLKQTTHAERDYRWVCPLQASLGTLIMVTGRCSTPQYNQDPALTTTAGKAITALGLMH